jgi:threonylcarbamoyladenosine tRNA methylthiotransferase MtaB
MRVAIKTLGCKLNQAESEEIADKLRSFGVGLTSSKEKADLYLINTCSITAAALKKSRQEIHKIRNKYKDAKIWACGCAKELKSQADKFLVDKDKIFEEIKRHCEERKRRSNPKKFLEGSGIASSHDVHRGTRNDKNKIVSQNRCTRAFLKIQDGCDNFCSYCVIPYRRGKPRSIKSSEIIKKINQKAKGGFKEVILEGVNILKYKDYPETYLFPERSEAKSKGLTALNPKFYPSTSSGNKILDFCDLIQEILSKTKILRLRFGSIDPNLVTDELIKLFRNDRVCKHLHLSLQSGSDKILEKMNRKYKVGDFLKIVKKIYQTYPNFGFTTDAIVGFPGETEKDFQDTYSLIKKAGFFKVHIFRYSKREGTRAALLSETCDERVKKERARKLALLNEKLKQNFYNKIIGKTLSILFENKRGNFWHGFADNYVKVRIKSDLNLKNQIKGVKIERDNLV